MNVHEIAMKIQQAGITQDTAVIVYHKSAFDLKLLRRYLESGGYFDLLPLDTNCIMMANILRPQLRDRLLGGKKVPLRLEVLFPLMYPRHSLVGLNHQALVDCQQTRLICMAYEELCKPIAERGEEWHPDTMARSAQRSILDWFQGKNRVEDANGAKPIR
jgi:hypothetical protein